MPDTSPLLLLIDGVLADDEEEIRSAAEDIRSLLKSKHAKNTKHATSEEEQEELPDPSASTENLCRMINALGQAFPEMVRTPSTNDGSLPLHFASSLGIPAVAQLLLSLFPAAATMPNAKGKIPLHYAAREGKIDMVRFFLHAAPETASIASDKDKLALHFAAGEGHIDVVRDLLTVFPAGASQPSAKGKLAIHFASRWGHLQVVHDLLAVHPQGISALDWEGSLPLHDAAREGQYRMARYLVERYPISLGIFNLRSEIPLFPAVRSGNVDLAVLLARAWPRGAQHVLAGLRADDNVRDENILEFLLRASVHCFRDCPLLEGREPPTVCLSDDMEVVVHTHATHTGKNQRKHKREPSIDPRSRSPVLAKKQRTVDHPTEPTEDEQRDNSKSTSGRLDQVNTRIFYPLHAAFQVGASFYVLTKALKTFADQQNVQDCSGRLPLHWAVSCCCNPDDERIPLVLEMINHASASVRENESGQLPLHMAIAARVDVRVLTALLEANLEAGVERWRDMLPIEMALHYKCDLSTIYHLLRVDPSVVREP